MPNINVIIDTIKNAINASTGNEDYMVGLRNGMRWCLSALTDKEPEYEDIPPVKSGWIPYSEPPTENDSYFVWMPFAPKGHHITVAEWCGSYWNIKTPITAWMPIPESWKEYEEK